MEEKKVDYTQAVTNVKPSEVVGGQPTIEVTSSRPGSERQKMTGDGEE